MTEPFTDADVQLVAEAIWQKLKDTDFPNLSGPPTAACFEDARAILAALAEAGRLTPDGAEQEPRKIFVAEHGAYSDYSVICAFESEADATEANVGDDILEMILYPPGRLPVMTHRGWTLTSRVTPEGEAAEYLPPSRSVHYDWEIGTSATPMPQRPSVEVRDLRSHGYWNCWLVTATGREIDDVRKALADRVAQLRAEALEPANAGPWVEADEDGTG